MNNDMLIRRLSCDLRDIGMPVDEVNIHIRPYSKTYYGNYFPEADKSGKPRIYIYPYETIKGKMYDYSFLLETMIHEVCHHIQYKDKDWKRLENVAHDTEFWKIYNKYILRAKILGVIKNECKSKTA